METNPNTGSTPAQKSTDKKPASTLSNYFAWVAIVLSLMVLVAGGYAWYRGATDTRVENGALLERIDVLEEQVETLMSTQNNSGIVLKQLQTQLNEVEQNLDAQIESVLDEILAQQDATTREEEKTRRKVEILSESMIKFQREFIRSVDHWSMEAVEQLMVIADQRLLFSADVVLAMKALQQAQSHLQQLSNPALQPVRELLASEIAALERVAIVDVAATLTEIAALSDDVDTLPLVGDVSASSAVEEGDDASINSSATDADGDSSMWKLFQQMLADLGALVQIESDGKPLTPIISTELRLMTFEKTKLILTSAELAFVREQGDIYRARMREAKNWIATNFDTDSIDVIKWLHRLDALAAVAPETDLPDVSASLEALQAVMETMKSGN